MTNIYMWTVYLAQNPDGIFYTGITTDLDKRIQQHNGLLTGGAKFTRGKGPWRIVHTELYPSKGTALRREAVIKKLSAYEKSLLAKIIPV
jgi:putative endonuclease